MVQKLWWGFAPSFSSHVRLGERGAPVLFPGTWWSPGASSLRVRGIPHLAKNERDAPNYLHAARNRAACAPFFKERRMRFIRSTKLHRQSGVWGTLHWLLGQSSKALANVY